MKPLFPYFGGKSLAAPLVWKLLGDCPRYVEPFCGSAAVLFNRPKEHHLAYDYEIINDYDGLIVNVWRSLKFEPESVVEYAAFPPSQLDLTARFREIRKYIKDKVESGKLRKLMAQNADYCDTRFAGFYIYGLANCIGQGWDKDKQLPRISVKSTFMQMSDSELRDLCINYQERLRHVIICCCDWKKLIDISNKWLFNLAPCGIFFDPPYSADNRRQTNKRIYINDNNGKDIAADVREWCLQNGKSPKLKIVIAGYDSEHDSLLDAGWTKHPWTAHSGYSRGAKKRQEFLWASPACKNSQLEFDFW